MRIPVSSYFVLVAALGLATGLAVPAKAQDRYYHPETCHEANDNAEAGGALTGAVVGGVAAGPVGAVVGAAVGGSAGDDSVHCGYERRENGYRYGDSYRTDRPYRNDSDVAYDNSPQDSDGYRQGYRDGYADATRGQEDGYYDANGDWHSAGGDPYRR